MRERLIYICSPLRGNYEINIQSARLYCLDVVEICPDAVPIAPHIYFTQFLNDKNPRERAIGIEMGLALLEKCDEVWVHGADHPSEGMMREIARARELGIPVYNACDMYRHIKGGKA